MMSSHSPMPRKMMSYVLSSVVCPFEGIQRVQKRGSKGCQNSGNV